MADRKSLVLVVDDSADNRDLLSRRVERLGHEATAVESGKEALDLLEREPVDLVLLDINMPVMNGYQVLEAIKKDEQWRKIPVLMVTALDNDEESVIRCIGLGADDYLRKPINARIFDARVTSCLIRRKLQEQEQKYRAAIEAARLAGDKLLYDLFPHPIVEQLRATRRVRSQRYHNVAVLFCDVVGFTSYCDQHEPEEVIGHLTGLIERLEAVSERHKLEKIKTIGDCFMATAGLHEHVENPVLACLQGAQAMLDEVRIHNSNWSVRIGIHVGPVVAGLVGKKCYCFDIWGDTVNTAARVQTAAMPGAICVSGAAWQHVSAQCRGNSCGMVELKGKPPMEIFEFVRFRSDSGTGVFPAVSG